MATPSSGPISLFDLNIEVKDSGTSPVRLGDLRTRALVNKYSGPISMADLRGLEVRTNTEITAAYDGGNANIGWFFAVHGSRPSGSDVIDGFDPTVYIDGITQQVGTMNFTVTASTIIAASTINRVVIILPNGETYSSNITSTNINGNRTRFLFPNSVVTMQPGATYRFILLG